MTGHLTDEQFAGLLSGDCDTSDHLLECAQCRQELSKVQASLEDFASHSLEWAEERASKSISTRSVLLHGWQSASAWTAAAAAVLTAAVLFAGQYQRTTQAPHTISVVASQAADSDSEVADDNRLMMAIDKEMQWQPQTLISVDELATPGRRSRETPSPRLTN
jgi:anti-sigma-K factor RskA